MFYCDILTFRDSHVFRVSTNRSYPSTPYPACRKVSQPVRQITRKNLTNSLEHIKLIGRQLLLNYNSCLRAFLFYYKLVLLSIIFQLLFFTRNSFIHISIIIIFANVECISVLVINLYYRK